MAANASPATLRRIRADLLDWYDREHRDFPWRATRDPYAVLVSEVMLQQTQAARVADRFPRFLRRFPTVHTLADAPAADVLAEWSGLGYNRRALALQQAAAVVAHDGWPPDPAGLERLPGIGPYTARAVASLAFGMAVGVVDTNVRRWLLRRFGVEGNPRELQRLADALATSGSATGGDDGRTDAWTHATMEFGASVCRSRQPRCHACPIARGCPSRGRATRIPVPRQAPLRGSDRAYRGAILRELTLRTDHAARTAVLRRALEHDIGRMGPAVDDAGWERVLAGLERDRLVHRSGGVVASGPPLQSAHEHDADGR